MWLPSTVFSEVDELAHVTYVDRAQCEAWNKHRKDGELRLLCGWAWSSKDGRKYQQGMKTETAAYRDCWYALCQNQLDAWHPRRRRLRLVQQAA